MHTLGEGGVEEGKACGGRKGTVRQLLMSLEANACGHTRVPPDCQQRHRGAPACCYGAYCSSRCHRLLLEEMK